MKLYYLSKKRKKKVTISKASHVRPIKQRSSKQLNTGNFPILKCTTISFTPQSPHQTLRDQILRYLKIASLANSAIQTKGLGLFLVAPSETQRNERQNSTMQ